MICGELYVCVHFHIKMTKCHGEIKESGIMEVICVCELWSWTVKDIGHDGKKRQSKRNKKCGINETKCRGLEKQ